MGSNRKRPFGYKMEFGEIVLHPAEAETVRWIYDHYLAGATCQKSPAQKELRKLCGGSPPAWVERQVRGLLNRLIQRPELIACPVLEAKPPSEVEKLRRELDELLHRPPVDEAQAKNLAFRLAALQLDAIGPEEYETRRLRRLFQGRAPMAELEQELLHESVRGITVSNGTVAVLLKNNQTLEGGNCT